MMRCEQFENLLDEHLDNLMSGQPDRQDRDVVKHLEDCGACVAELEARQSLRSALKALPVERPNEDFFSLAVDRAAAASELSRRRGDRAPPGARRPAWGALMAAAFGIVFLASVVFTTLPESPAPEDGLPAITLVTDEVTPVKLAFSSETALADARLSIQLPVGVELVGYNGQTDLSWNTTLEPGKNVLRLPLVGRTAAASRGPELLVARLEHPTGTKTFRLQVTVN